METAMEALKQLPLLTFPPGAIILEQGGAEGRVYFLADGTVEVRDNQDSHEGSLRF